MADLNSIEVQNRTVTAFFDTREAADKAVDDVVAIGIPRQHVTVTGSTAAGGTAAVGTAASGTATGETGTGFLDSLKNMFLPEEDQHAYAEGLRRGGYVVSVQTEEGNYTRVLDILDRDGAVDLDQREASWRSEGWTGYAAAGAADASVGTTGLAATAPAATIASGTGAARTETARPSSVALGSDEVIPVYEERLRVGKRDVDHGRVRVRSYVVATPVSEQVSLHSESVQVERRPVDRAVAAGEALFQDRVIEASERAEEAVASKEARVVEEIALRKTAADTVRTVSDSVRRTEVEIDDGRLANVGTRAVSGAVADASLIKEHMDVIAADGAKIGTVDHLDGPDRIKLTRQSSPDGQHHYVPLAWVDHVDTHVHLTKSAADAKAAW